MKPMLVVGHGTRSADGVIEFGQFVERLRKRAEVDVAGGFIELSRPPVTDAVAELVARGHRKLVAVPLILVAAGHGKGDIPAALEREKARYPGLTYQYGRPLGPHPALLTLLEQRVDDALGDVSRAAATVVLVGRGSTDPDANAEVCKVARLLWEGRGYADVVPSFISLAEPTVPAALDRAARLGAHRIVVSPYFLFPGILPDRIVSQATHWARETGADVRVAEVLGDSDELASLVEERYREALAGDIRMNCDTCIYRVAMPGYESRVGAAQRPHHHPDDPDHHHHDHA